MVLTVLSWNILSQFTIEEGKMELVWSKRLPRILELLTVSAADIICLQEVDLATFETSFAPLFSTYKYERHQIIPSGKNKRTNPFGNAILWKVGSASNVARSSRCLHVTLRLLHGFEFIVTNVHFPAKNGLEGYKEKYRHLESCTKVWKDSLNVVFGGDFNDGLCFRDDTGIIGLGHDVHELKFHVPPEELEKKTCKSFQGNIYNVDHVLVRGNLRSNYIPTKLDVSDIPNAAIPTDHLPIIYQIEYVL